MRKKTVEELRAGNARRQREWRAKHKWLAEQRRLALYGKSKADKVVGLDGPMTEEEERKYQETHLEDMAFVEGEPETVLGHIKSVEKRTHRAYTGHLPIEKVVMRGGGRTETDIWDEAKVLDARILDNDPELPVKRTAEEDRAQSQLDRLLAKRRAKGVYVDL